MKKSGAPLPNDEKGRLKALRRFEILDSDPEPAFERMTRIAAAFLGAPVALVSLVDEYRQWFLSARGLPIRETPREQAFCAHAILAPDQVLVVDNPTEDERFRDNPLVTGEPNIRFYAGAPLNVRDGHAIGTLCVIDTKERPPLTEDEERLLRDLAETVVDEMELRLALREAADVARFAERVNEAKSDFVTSLNEDLRAPMHAILQIGQQFASDTPPEPRVAHEKAQKLVQTSEKLLASLNEMMEVFYIDSERSSLNMMEIAVRPEMDILVQMLRGRASQKDVEIVNRIDPTINVPCDRNRFRQIARRLLENSIKYNKPGGVVEIDMRIRPDGMSEIDICDEGTGLTPEGLERLFAPDGQIDRHRDADTGRGLGLVLARRLAQAMGGDIALANRAEGGCRATIRLPVG